MSCSSVWPTNGLTRYYPALYRFKQVVALACAVMNIAGHETPVCTSCWCRSSPEIPGNEISMTKQSACDAASVARFIQIDQKLDAIVDAALAARIPSVRGADLQNNIRFILHNSNQPIGVRHCADFAMARQALYCDRAASTRFLSNDPSTM